MSDTFSLSLPIPGWVIRYNGRDLTARTADLIVEIGYEESTGKRACGIELKLADPLQHMQTTPPTVGDTLDLMLGYAGGVMYPVGTFEIDEFELDVAPDIFVIKAIQAGLTNAVRTNNNVSYEGQTLLQIAGTVAARHGFTVVGNAVSPDVPYDRVTQNMEPDLAFLHRLANMHNYDFNLRNNTLVFYSRPALEAMPPVGTITRAQIIPGRTKFKTQLLGKQTYKNCLVTYFDPKTKRLVEARAVDVNVPTADTLHAVERVENGQQAALRAQGYLHQANMHKIVGTVLMPGSMQYRAGKNVNVAGFGVFDQSTYQIHKAHHRLSREGWITELSLRVHVAGGANQQVGGVVIQNAPPPGLRAGM